MASRRRKGFSLIEVMFGVFIAAIIASILAATMPIAGKSRVKAANQNKAFTLAQKEIEAIRSMGYPNCTPQQLYDNGLIDSTTAVAANTYSFSNVDNAMFDNPAIVLSQGEGRVIIEQPGLDLKRITVEVSWNDAGRTRTVRLGTSIANL